jgi:hypothetical protein
MNNKYTSRALRGFSIALSVAALATVIGLNSCDRKAAKESVVRVAPVVNTTSTAESAAGAGSGGRNGATQVMSSVLTVAGIRPIAGTSAIEVFFNENAEFFTITDVSLVEAVKVAFSANKPVYATFDPWQGVLVKIEQPNDQQLADLRLRPVNVENGKAIKVDLKSMADNDVNEPQALGVLNTTDPGLNNVIPDFATAQLMFDYIVRQCCALPGPYGIDKCISFQYCQDGCYARAHKMCWVINNRYKYGTKKIFSFANAGSDKLCVQAQKWGGCCIRWWYHVAPLVTVQTPTGPKAYVFDPAMFNQPVLLATWLHAQENPACAGSFTPHVTMINVQPTSSYTPSGSSGLTFSTDPTFSSTNSTLTTYAPRVTCP